jgi:deoxyribose-phosphate aldolase
MNASSLAPSLAPSLATAPAHPSLALDEAARAKSDLARLIDSTLLKPATRASDIEALCADALARGFRSVCVPPCHVSLARLALDAGNATRAAADAVLVCTVVGFPNGYATTATKVHETREAIAAGAQEIDFVQNVAWVKDEDRASLAAETRAIVAAAGGALVKVILETSLLEPQEIEDCSALHAEAGAHVVKTSTGFGARGASLTDIEAMSRGLARATARTGLCYGIKASGGVRGREEALAYVARGVTRIGSSSGATLLSDVVAAPGPATGY